MQPVHFRTARRTLVHVAAGHPGSLAVPHGQQVFHGAMLRHLCSSPSQVLSRACARANCDFEKLTVMPIISAMSSCV